MSTEIKTPADLELNRGRLVDLILSMQSEVRGPCSQTACCIGVVNGKQVHLRIVGELDEDDFMKVNEKFICVRGKNLEAPTAEKAEPPVPAKRKGGRPRTVMAVSPSVKPEAIKRAAGASLPADAAKPVRRTALAINPGVVGSAERPAMPEALAKKYGAEEA